MTDSVRVAELDDAAALRAGLTQQLLNYHYNHKEPEWFVRKVLENGLMGAVLCWNLFDRGRQARHLVRYAYRWIPAEEWGSPARVAEWLAGSPWHRHSAD